MSLSYNHFVRNSKSMLSATTSWKICSTAFLALAKAAACLADYPYATSSQPDSTTG